MQFLPLTFILSRTLAIGCAVLSVCFTPPAAAQSSQTLDAKIASVLPTPTEERWLAIPWRYDLMQARLEAQNLNRPLFLWVMNGNPMGCT